MVKTTRAKPDTRDPRSVWSVRGVPHDAREAATKAAELAQVSIGEWLGRVIHEAGVVEIKESRAVGKTVEQMAAEMAAALTAFTEAQGKQQEESRRYTDGLQQITARLDALEESRQRGFFERLFGVRTMKAKGPASVSSPAPHS